MSLSRLAFSSTFVSCSSSSSSTAFDFGFPFLLGHHNNSDREWGSMTHLPCPFFQCAGLDGARGWTLLEDWIKVNTELSTPSDFAFAGQKFFCSCHHCLKVIL